jgi:uridylate kinase
MAAYKRILLKLSGEALMASKSYGIDSDRLMTYARQIKAASALDVKIGIVIGGGNIFRGLQGANHGFDRIKGDYMGMLATVINGLALSSALENLGVPNRVLTAIRMEPVGEFYNKRTVEEAFRKNEIVIFSAGTGNPFFTTDTASALRAVEMDADILLKGTRVDGIYDKDPEKYTDAIRFSEITMEETYARGLQIMDLTAITLCRENKLPIIVFDMNLEGNLLRLLKGESAGTLVRP